MTRATGMNGGVTGDRRRLLRSLVDTVIERSPWRPAPRRPVDERPRRPRPAVVLQTDIVGSTILLAAARDHYPGLLVRHRDLIGAAVRRAGGRFLTHAGDGTLAVFDRADDAIAASVDAQRALRAERWPDGLSLRVRMGVHVGEIYEIDGEPVGLVINQGARIMAAAEAGQVVVSSEVVTAAAPCDAPRGGDYPFADAGWHALRDYDRPVRLRQVVADGLTVVLPADRLIDLTEPALAGTSAN
jgi:class 3 adenylate cyclase